MFNQFFGLIEDILFGDENDGIDFEVEFGVIILEVLFGVDVGICVEYICLIVQINDWLLWCFVFVEMKIGFGWICVKFVCVMVLVVIMLDEFGVYWWD